MSGASADGSSGIFGRVASFWRGGASGDAAGQSCAAGEAQKSQITWDTASTPETTASGAVPPHVLRAGRVIAAPVLFQPRPLG